jgi:hypothetical protein
MKLHMTVLLHGAATLFYGCSHGDRDERTGKADKLFAQWKRLDLRAALWASCETASSCCAAVTVRLAWLTEPRSAPTPFSAWLRMSKQFTAACAGLVITQGKLSLDDDVRNYIPTTATGFS